MRGKIKMVIVALVVILIAGTFTPENVWAASKEKVTCKQVEKSIKRKYGKFGKVKFYKSEKLKNKTLLHRKGTGKIIVEKCSGVVVNNKGDGKYNASNGKSYYICYAGWVKNAKKGMKVTSYFVYNKDTNYTDDVVERYDVVTKR